MASRRAAELAFAVVEPDGMVTVVHVVPKETSRGDGSHGR